jgi:hypothetical protein
MKLISKEFPTIVYVRDLPILTCELTSRMLSENLFGLSVRVLVMNFQFEEADE